MRERVGSMGGVWLVQFCLFWCFYLLLPAYVVIAARASTNTTAAMGNGLLFATTVAAELCAPALLARSGTRRVVVIALLGVGVGPTLLLVQRAGVWLLLTVAALRGAGFGIGAVAIVQLAMRLTRGERARQRLSLFSLASAIPSIAGSAVGLLVLHLWSTGSVVAVTAAIALGGIGAACFALRREESAREAWSAPRPQLQVRGWFAAQTRDERTLVISVCVAVLFFYAVRGGFVVGAALSLPGSGLGGSTSFFLVNGLAFAAGRIVAGLASVARWRGSMVLPAGVLAAAAGILTLWWSGGRPAAVVAVAALSGLAVGLYAIESLVSLASSSLGEVRSSVLWNVSIDIGLGGGGVVMGWVLATRLSLATSGTLVAMALCPLFARSLVQRRLDRHGAPMANATSLGTRWTA